MRPEIWIGTIEISFANPDAPDVMKRAFTVILTWASSPEEFSRKSAKMLEGHGWMLLAVERANPVNSDDVFSDEVEDMLDRTRRNPDAIIYGTFHTYPTM
jgi:hypothetical protein